MELILHQDILLKLLAGDRFACDIFTHAQMHKYKMYASTDLVNQIDSMRNPPKKFIISIWTSNYFKLKEFVTFVNFHSISTEYYKNYSDLYDTNWALSIAVANHLKITTIWTDIPILLEDSKVIFLTTKDFDNILPDIEEESETTSSNEEANPSEKYNYTNYGDQSDYNWLEDNRLDPMFYERFLHFYGVRDLKDNQIYYLNPDDKSKLALPTPKKKKYNKYELDIDREGNDYNIPLHTEVLYPARKPSWYRPTLEISDFKAKSPALQQFFLYQESTGNLNLYLVNALPGTFYFTNSKNDEKDYQEVVLVDIRTTNKHRHFEFGERAILNAIDESNTINLRVFFIDTHSKRILEANRDLYRYYFLTKIDRDDSELLNALKSLLYATVSLQNEKQLDIGAVIKIPIPDMILDFVNCDDWTILSSNFTENFIANWKYDEKSQKYQKILPI